MVLYFVRGMRFETLSLGCLWCSESLGLVLGRLFPFICTFVLPNPVGQSLGKTPISEAQRRRF